MGEFLMFAATGGEATAGLKVEYSSIIPIMVLAGGGIALMLASSMIRERMTAATGAFLSIVLTLIAMGSTYYTWKDLDKTGAYSTFMGSIANDKFTLFFVVVLCAALILSLLVSIDWLEERGVRGIEYFVLMLMSTTGAILMAAANDLIVIFLGLEILSIALYVLCGFDRKSRVARESALKYFILGSFSSAIFLYGIALVYGATGTTNLTGIAQFLSTNTLLDNGLLLAGVVLLAVGFAFKVAAAPFHQWTPDVYQGAPTPVTGYMAAAAKAAAFAALLRVFAATFTSLQLDWKPLILGLAIATLLVGSIVACVQQNVKRMLAYSSISHAGYILLGLYATNVDGISSSLFYLLAYTFMVVGSFAIVSLVGGQDESRRGLDAFRGLAQRNPGIALVFSIFLLAQAGMPLTSGFLAKFYVISALVQGHSYEMAVFAMLIAAVAAFFYLRIVVAMYTPASSPAPSPLVMPFSTGLAVVFSLVLTIGLGVIPSSFTFDAVEFARSAAGELFISSSTRIAGQ